MVDVACFVFLWFCLLLARLSPLMAGVIKREIRIFAQKLGGVLGFGGICINIGIQPCKRRFWGKRIRQMKIFLSNELQPPA